MSEDAPPLSGAVLHLISSLEVGGAERLLIDFVKSCTETLQIPQVVVVMNNRVDQNMANDLNAASVPTYYLGRPQSSRNPLYLLDLLKIVRTHHVAVIHSHTRGSKYWSALCRAFSHNIKLAHTLHDTRISMNSIDVFFHNATINLTFAISRPVANEARSLNIKRVTQINNGIPTSQFRFISPKTPGSTTKIVCVGRISPEKKGQDILIQSIKRCVDRGFDVECAFVGNPATGDVKTVPRLETLTASLGLTGRVHFVQGRTDVATLLADADIFVLPSRWEGFGLALVEAMAAGLPVIASNIDGPADILTDGIDGLLFESGSDEQLADRISTLVESPDLADKLRNNARVKASEYDIATMRDKYIAEYTCLIETG